VDELVALHLPNVHICVTSRPEHDIRVVLEHLTEHPVSLHDESGQQEDITNYVTSFVQSNQRMRRWRGEDKNLVIKILSEKADGMYVCCHLLSCESKHGIGSAGCSANWKSCGTVFHQVSGVSWRNCQKAWTRRTNGY
jgi:hypothetical protein